MKQCGNDIVLITGASRGIGKALAVEMANRGYTVYGTFRQLPKDAQKLSFKPLLIDVTDTASINSAVKNILNEHGNIDILVNNAGITQCGPLEETSEDYARLVFDTNYFGMINVTRTVLPYMRKNRSGTIVNVGSAAGKIALPLQAHYSASKFAVEALTESLWYELRPFGIRVLLLEPGDIETELWDRADKPASADSAYSEMLEKFYNVKEQEMGAKATSVESAARRMADIVMSDTKKLRHLLARMAWFFLAMRKLLPD